MDEVLPAIIDRVPPPSGSPDKPLKVLLFDSWFDQYRGSNYSYLITYLGVIILVEVIDGILKKGNFPRIF